MESAIVIVVIFLVANMFCWSSQELQIQWVNFKKVHQKLYNRIEEAKRIKIFKENLEKIQEHNKLYDLKKVTFKMGLNQFADMTQEEFAQYAGGHKFNATASTVSITEFVSVSEIPKEIDWRKKGAVTEVKNQGTCGSCWAFSVTGALESQVFLKTGRLVSLSEQELVDCIVIRLVRGCNGGLIDNGYKYVIKRGLSSEADYPYENEDGLCHRGSLPSAVSENGYVRIFGNEDSLKEAVGTIGPIAVTVDASKWQFYEEGIFSNESCETDPNLLNHAVLVVGYGTDNGSAYWLIKNSYGPEWGDEGYIKMARNANNMCGIASTPSYPTV